MATNDAAFTGNIPEHYDAGLGPIIFADYAADMAARVAALRPARVLETAAGTGIVTRMLRDRLPAETRITATDLNAPMLEVAKQKFKAGEAVQIEPADAQALSFADASFEALVCQFGIMFYPDRPKSYREALRVLVPGGRYLFSVWDSHRYNAFARITHGLIGKFFPTDPPQFYNVPFSCAAIDPIKEALIEAGFTGIDIAVLSIDKVVPDAALFARGLVYGNPLIDQLKARGGDPAKLHEAVVAELHREFGPDPFRMPLQTILYSARRPT